MLGKDQFIEAMENNPTGLICPSPLAWLQAGCEGFCPFDLAEGYQDGQRMRVRLTKLESVA